MAEVRRGDGAVGDIGRDPAGPEIERDPPLYRGRGDPVLRSSGNHGRAGEQPGRSQLLEWSMEEVNYVKHLNGVFRQFARDSRLNPTHISLYMALFQLWNINYFQAVIF